MMPHDLPQSKASLAGAVVGLGKVLGPDLSVPVLVDMVLKLLR